MATFVALYNRIYFGHLDVTPLSDKIDFGPIQVQKKAFTNFASGGYPEYKPGLRGGDYSLGLFQDYATGVLDDQLTLTTLGNTWPITMVPNPAATDTAGDPAMLAQAIIMTRNTGQTVGEAAMAPITGTYTGPIIRGLVAHPSAARTTTGNGTAVALTGPTATQRLYASVHLLAYSGITNVVFKVQSDNGAGMASPTDRITFTTMTAVGSQHSSVAGDFSTETHQRLTWTITGAGSITFFAAFGVL